MLVSNTHVPFHLPMLMMEHALSAVSLEVILSAFAVGTPLCTNSSTPADRKNHDVVHARTYCASLSP